MTVSPYLGDDSLTPFVDAAHEHQAGIFVLVKTSNPGGKTFQDRMIDGQPLYRLAGQLVDSLNQDSPDQIRLSRDGYGPVGAVVGATYPEQLEELRAAMPHTWFLVPGFGAQGGDAKSVRHAFDDRGLGAVVNNSRGIIFAHERPEFARFGHRQWQRAIEAATRKMADELREATSAGKLVTQSGD